MSSKLNPYHIENRRDKSTTTVSFSPAGHQFRRCIKTLVDPKLLSFLENFRKMKFSLALLGLASAGDFMSKEWEVAEAYYNDKPIVLQDPDDERSRNKQWHDCGDKPATPNNARDVVCNGKWCAAVCNQGKHQMSHL